MSARLSKLPLIIKRIELLVQMGADIAPPSSSVIASLTIDYLGDLPVNFPVFTDTAPKDDSSPNPCSTVLSLNASGELVFYVCVVNSVFI